MSISTERVLDAIIGARQSVSRQRGYPIYPETPVCESVCDYTAALLATDEFENILLSLPDTIHHVLRERGNQCRIFDPQYKQFIPPEGRDSLPDTLVLNPSDKVDLTNKLKKMGMPQEVAESYAAALNL
jgi:hypothetical protein